MNSQGQPAAPLPSFMPTHLKVLNESGAAPSFVHRGEKVTALPEPVEAKPSVSAQAEATGTDGVEAAAADDVQAIESSALTRSLIRPT